ncbi:MAG: hypothetical protein ACOY5B_14195 [Spirochaetota bacterium]
MPADQKEAAERESFLRDARDIVANPLSQETKNRCVNTLKYATESEDISVEVSEQNGVVWLMEKGHHTKENSALLLCAYIAGNARAQLENNAKGNDTLAGVNAVLAVYGKLRQANDKFRLKSIDEMAAAVKAGKLSEFLKQRGKKPD